jgi:glycosyltransferase involved in cell wall biosynthesis
MASLAGERDGWQRKAENTPPWLVRHLRTVVRLLYRFVVYRLGGRLGQTVKSTKELITPPPASAPVSTPPALLTRELVERHVLSRRRLEALPLEGLAPRLTLVSDTLATASMSGRVATSVIVAAELAAATGSRLRIVTFDGQTGQDHVVRILTAAGIAIGSDVQVVHAGMSERSSIDVGAQDTFLTTSWRTTYACRDIVPDAKITYLIQDDERETCGESDDRLRCEEVLRSDKLRFIVNSKLLHQHLVSAGFENVARNGKWFEPAVDASHSGALRIDAPRKTFVFHAHPDDGRALFYRGIEAIDEAVKRGVFAGGAWEFVFVGDNLDARLAELPYRPTLMQNPGPDEYAALLRRADAGLSPVYAPHPGAEPLELAAAGAVVVTTRYGAKRDLSQYSRNIICAESDTASLVAALKMAVSLANDTAQRTDHVRNDGIGRDWRSALRGAIAALAGRTCS